MSHIDCDIEMIKRGGTDAFFLAEIYHLLLSYGEPKDSERMIRLAEIAEKQPLFNRTRGARPFDLPRESMGLYDFMDKWY
jgi:hypothetical protein